MRTLIDRATAKVKGKTGERQHRAIVDNIFTTRDNLEDAANNMMHEMDSNATAIAALRERNKDLYTNISHARRVAARIHEFFLPQ